MKIGTISLGCDKNRVDTEKMLARALKNHEITQNLEEAEVLIVNTCAFITSARKEAVDTLLEMASYKKNGSCKSVIATGCLPEKYIDDIFEDFVEVDGFLGCNDYDKIEEAIEESLTKRVNFVGKGGTETLSEREITTPYHYAYLKIAEGCDNKCTYCTIPSIRGKFISKPLESLVKECESLSVGGAEEIILVAQDVTSYGKDIGLTLVDLLKAISKIESVQRIRLLYCYPEQITPQLISEIKENPKILKYLDIPLQHASSKVLKRMGRKGTFENYVALFENLQNEIPGITFRTTFMVGFPGEEEEDVAKIYDFLNLFEIASPGVFVYSKEEDTPSAKLPGQIPENVKNQRYEKLTKFLAEMSMKNAEKKIGQVLDIVYEEIDYENQRFVGRAMFQAPEIDTLTFFHSKEEVLVGSVYKVKIIATENGDLIGERL